MKSQNGKTFLATAFAAMFAATAVAERPAYVNGARVEGAEPGEWTHDWDAATAAAKKDGKPVFVNFTGSDWCGWCKLLKRQVFTQPEWGAWASNHVYLVHLDFPNDKALVPEKYRERNRELSRRYKVGGYPTCYLLDPATLEPIGRFGASRDASAADFVGKVAAAIPGAGKAESSGPKRPERQAPVPRTGEPVFEIENGVLRGVKSGDAEEIVVPEGVKTVCIDGLVHGRMKILTIPEGVESLSKRSGGYYPGAAIETVRLPASVSSIRATAFDGHWRRLRTIEVAAGSPFAMRDGCLVDTRDDSLVFALPGRERIVLPRSVKTVGDWSVAANDAREIVVPEGVVKIGRGAFNDCRSLEVLSLPASVEEIAKDAFSNCGKLARIDVSPDNPRYAARDGFLLDRRTGTLLRAFGPLVRVAVPDDVRTIGDHSFSFLDTLVSVTVPDSVRRIEDGAFAYCKNLEEILLPERLDFCDSHFIMGCKQLKAIRLPAGLETVHGNFSFGGCSSLSELVLPEGVRTIGSGGLGAVCRCENLERIVIPASVSRIPGGAFNENPRLKAFVVHPDNRDFRAEDGILFTKDMKRLIRCPETKKGVYDVPGTVTIIDTRAFSGCRDLAEIRIPASVSEIGWGAFENCPAKTNCVDASAMAGAKSNTPARIESGNRTVQGPTVTTNDFKAVLTGIAVVDDKDRNKTAEAAFVPPGTKVEVPYGKTVLFRVEYDFPEGYEAHVWTRDGMCDDGKRHCWYFGSNPSRMYKGKGTAYGFLSLLDRGKTCRVKELLILTSTAPDLDNYPHEWTMATVPIDVEFLEKPRETGRSDPAQVSVPKDLTGPYGIRMQPDPGCEKGAEYVLRRLVEDYLPVAVRYYGNPFGGKTPSRVFTIAVKRNDGSDGRGHTGSSWGSCSDGVDKFTIGLAKGSDKWEMDLTLVASKVLTVCREDVGFSLYVNDFISGDAKGIDPVPEIKEMIREGLTKEGDGKINGRLRVLRKYAPMWSVFEELRARHPNFMLDYCNLKNSRYAEGKLPQELSFDQVAGLLGEATGENMAELFKKYGVESPDFVEKVSAKMAGAKSNTPAEPKRPDRPVPPPAAAGAFTGTPGKLPLDKLPAADRIAWFDFSEGKADKARPDRSFDCRNVAFEDGAMRFNGVYVNSIEGRTNGCNAELRVPELDCDGFTVCLSFRPERNGRSYLPLLNFGHARRWFSANLGRNGRVWFGLNCYDVQIETEGRAVDGDWNWLVCSVDAVGKTVRAALNGVRLDDAHLPSDFFYKLLPTQLESLKTVDTTFWNGGDAFKGEIAHFVLIGRPLSDGEFKAFSAASAPAGWTAKTGTSKSMYWNSMLSDGKRDIPARVDGSRVFLHPGLQGASGAVDLRGPVADDTGKTIRIVGIGQEPSIQKDLFVGGGCAASSVLLPDSLEWIGRAGFKGCRNLRELKIPASVKSIGADAFADCPALERIEFEDRTFKLNDNVFGTPVRGEKVRRPATNLEGE